MNDTKKQPRVCVGVLILNPQDEILFMRSHKWKNKWIVPGGGVEWGEKTADTARRETLEETGLSLTDVTFLQTQEYVSHEEFHKEQHFIFFDYYAKTADTEVVLNDEAEEYKWLRPEEALQIDLNKSTRIFLESYINRAKSD